MIKINSLQDKKANLMKNSLINFFNQSNKESHKRNLFHKLVHHKKQFLKI